MESSNEFQNTLNLLRQLPDIQFRDSIRSFLTREQLQSLPKPIDYIYRGETLDYIRELGKLADFENFIKTNYPDLSSAESVLVDTTNFVNRQQEIDAILAPELTVSKFLVCAPAGYGKSLLLKELKKRYIKDSTRKWDSAVSSINSDANLEEINLKLSLDLENQLNIHIVQRDSILTLGDVVGRELLGKYHSSQKEQSNDSIQGLVILIDLEGEPHTNLLKIITEKFVPQLEKRLKIYNPYLEDKFLFRIVIAGRYLSKLEDTSIPDEYVKIHLTPFKIDTIRRSARNHFGAFDKKITDELAAHALFLGAGHPGSMAHTFSLFSEDPSPSDSFFYNYQSIILEKTISYAYETIERLNKISPDFTEILPMLSLFRYLCDPLLDSLLEKYPIETIRDGMELGDQLRDTYLFGFDYSSQLTRDDITRRVLAIHFCHSPSEMTSFAERCDFAITLCRDRIVDIYEPSCEKWIIEYLFQNLQKHMHESSLDREARKQLRESYFDTILPSIIALLAERVEKVILERRLGEWNRYWRALQNEIENPDQWEFRFLLKYLLRDDFYNDQPYTELKKVLSRSITLPPRLES